jgi:hypothetical protein
MYPTAFLHIRSGCVDGAEDLMQGALATVIDGRSINLLVLA